MLLDFVRKPWVSCIPVHANVHASFVLRGTMLQLSPTLTNLAQLDMTVALPDGICTWKSDAIDLVSLVVNLVQQAM